MNGGRAHYNRQNQNRSDTNKLAKLFENYLETSSYEEKAKILSEKLFEIANNLNITKNKARKFYNYLLNIYNEVILKLSSEENIPSEKIEELKVKIAMLKPYIFYDCKRPGGGGNLTSFKNFIDKMVDTLITVENNNEFKEKLEESSRFFEALIAYLKK